MHRKKSEPKNAQVNKIYLFDGTENQMAKSHKKMREIQKPGSFEAKSGKLNLPTLVEQDLSSVKSAENLE